MLTMTTFYHVCCSVVLLLPLQLVEAKRASQELPLDFEIFIDYLRDGMKVLLATSPILVIVGIVACAREDDETEQAKRESTARSCKR